MRLFYTAVRWYSKVKVITGFFDLRTEIKLFLETEKNNTYNNFSAMKHGYRVWFILLTFLNT